MAAVEFNTQEKACSAASARVDGNITAGKTSGITTVTLCAQSKCFGSSWTGFTLVNTWP